MNKGLRFLTYLLRYKLGITAVVAGIAVAVSFRLLVPALINVITVDINKRVSLGTILFYSLAIIGVTSISGVGQFAYSYLTQTTGNKVIYDIRQDLFKSIQLKSFAFYDQNQVGDLIARATGDVEAVRRFVTQSMGALLFTSALMVGVVVELLQLNPLLLLPGVGLVPLVAVTGFIFDMQQSPNWKLVREQYAVLNTVLEENLAGLRVVRAFTREDFEIKKFDEVNRKYYKTNIEVAKTRAFFIPLMPLLIGLNIALLFYFGGIEVINGSVSIGDLVEAYSILVIITPNARFLGLTLSQALNAGWGLDRIFSTIDTISDIQDSPNAIDLEEPKGDVVFENVSFGYDRSKPLLNKINISVHAGETIAIVGKTGSGKTTFANLIPRFYDVTSGRITIDGIDVRDLKLRSLRKMIGVVSQETFLFSRTIRENIAFGVRDASLEDIIRCAKIAHADDFIRTFPNGYDTIVGERGNTLSGGQKQRVAIARALLVDPTMLIFDDSTSSVDVETEHEIREAMRSMVAHRTTFLITQRLSTVRLADRVAVFDKGELVELGAHDELMRNNGVYAQIFGAQLTRPTQEVRRKA